MKKLFYTLVLLMAISLSIGNYHHYCYNPCYNPGCSRTIIMPDGDAAVEVPGSCGTSYIILPDGRTITVIR
jgi:hypothetical protein